MTFHLKDYQQRCLDNLASYLRQVIATGDAGLSFTSITGRKFRDVKSLPPGLPYVCVRVPTGGGKTVLAAHSIGIAAREYLRLERCMVLWLAPTTRIVDQTLSALRDRRHPYRMALDEAFGGNVTILDLSSALSLSRSAVESDTVVIVSTVATMRVDKTEGRKVYEGNGQLMSHFTEMSASQRRALLKANDSKTVIPSLANLLFLRRPLAIVDEAHNARTALSFEALSRFNPACIIEFTATPDEDPEGDPSNVLVQVSAAELKCDEMIKLPIRLVTNPGWREAVAAAIAKQRELEQLATQEESSTQEYVRPIVLFQAQRDIKGQDCVTHSVLKHALIGEFEIPEDQIAVATGAADELEGIQILDRICPVRFIITVDKLREGWDCPFAYILCSVSNLTSKTAVEQILGRVLRMPHAQRKKADALNHAYAFVTSPGFAEAARATEVLVDALVEGGFERYEARTMVKQAVQESINYDFGLFSTISEIVSVAPALETLPEQLRTKVEIRKSETGIDLAYSGPPMVDPERLALKAHFKSQDDLEAIDRLFLRSRNESVSPAAMGRKFVVPRLAIRLGEQLELFDEQFREVPWRLLEFDHVLSEAEFPIGRPTREAFDVDVDSRGKFHSQFIALLQEELSLQDAWGPTDPVTLAAWLDSHITHPDITCAESSLFLHRVIQSLITDRGVPIQYLSEQRIRLRDAAAQKIDFYRREVSRGEFQRLLLPGCDTPLEVSPSVCLSYPMDQYPAPKLYDGPRDFHRHYYDRPADMNGEEAMCAAFIDNSPAVRHWVRNLVRSDFAFWLPTSTDKFYPDFVAELCDGRYLVVEYKGERDLQTEDTLEKKLIGELWQERSRGACVFRIVTLTNMEREIGAAIGAA